jgi:arylsulfatase A-like enzyme
LFSELSHRPHLRWIMAIGVGAVIGCAKPAPAPAMPVATAPAPVVAAPPPAQPAAETGKRRVIMMVWDGLRPDSIDPALTPVLARLRDERGVDFTNHHSVYPTLTMMNAAALATGARSAVHGFYGNTEYQPGPSGKNAKGADVDYAQPVFTEDHAILQALDAFQRAAGSALLHVQTVFDVAHAAGVSTAAIGKAGPAFLADYTERGEHGVVLDENVVLPRAFGLALQAAGLPLPKNTAHQAYSDGALELDANNDDPSAPTEPTLVTLADGVTPDPRAAAGSPHNARNAYMMRVFIEFVLPKLDPGLALIWLRNPDSTQHSYGPGSPNALDALRHQDELLGELLAALARLGRADSTDVLIVSDHGHSTVASDPALFPPRALDGAPDGHAGLGAPSSTGYAVSGDVRSADWLRRAGFPHVYDGAGCAFDPVLGGVDAHGAALHSTREDAACGAQPRFSTPAYRVPAGPLPQDAIVIAPNGGSEFYYVLDHDARSVLRLVTALQERAPYGPVFVGARYGAIAGTLPLARIGLENDQSVSPPTPDVVVSFDWDDAAEGGAGASMPGTEHSTPAGYRGMHGSFSPVDVHNTLIAIGPDFRSGLHSALPSSNLDVAPTIAALLGLALPHAEGRVLDEAFASNHNPDHYRVESFVEDVAPARVSRVCLANDLDCKHPRAAAQYAFKLFGQTLTAPDGKQYVYLDKAKATRTPAGRAAR